MAVKNTSSTFTTVMGELKRGTYRPVYLLMGDEPYYIDKVSDFISNNVLAPDDRYFNQDVVFGSDVNAARVVELSRGYPMMPAQYRVVVVKEAQDMKSTDALEKYLEHPVQTTILVLCFKNGVLKKRTLVDKAKAAGVVLESKKKRDSELPGFIESYLLMHKMSIDPKASSMIAEHIGADLNRIASELDKLIVALADGDRRVTPEIVEQQIGVSKDFNIFELQRAIVVKDVFKANQIVNYFDKNPKSGGIYTCLPMLFRFFQNLMTAHYAPNKQSETAVAAQLELKSTWGVRDYMTAMRHYSAAKTLQIIYKIREIDAKSKGLDNQTTSSGDLMDELFFFILQ